MRLCRDCNHLGFRADCLREPPKVDPVRGRKVYKPAVIARQAGGTCGVRAKHFEPKVSLLTRLIEKVNGGKL